VFVPANLIHIFCSFSWMCLSLWPVSEKTAKLVSSLRLGLCICFTSFTLVLSYGVVSVPLESFNADSCARKIFEQIFERVATVHNPHMFSSLDFCVRLPLLTLPPSLGSFRDKDWIGLALFPRFCNCGILWVCCGAILSLLEKAWLNFIYAGRTT